LSRKQVLASLFPGGPSFLLALRRLRTSYQGGESIWVRKGIHRTEARSFKLGELAAGSGNFSWRVMKTAK
jgi:hypothetical protein